MPDFSTAPGERPATQNSIPSDSEFDLETRQRLFRHAAEEIWSRMLSRTEREIEGYISEFRDIVESARQRIILPGEVSTGADALCARC